MPVGEVTPRKSDILQRNKKSNTNGSYDHRPPEYQTFGNNVIEELCYNLLSLNQPSAFLDILVPSKEKVKHDHTYSLPPEMSVDIKKQKNLIM